MKKILLIIFLISSLKFYGQNPQLFPNTWYLTELIRGGVSYYPPADFSVPFVTLNFSANIGNSFITSVCNTLSSVNVSFNDVNSTFSYLNSGVTLGVCVLPVNNFFDQYYLGFYYASSPPVTMSYSITQQNGIYSLIVTSSINEKAIYRSQPLSTNMQAEQFVSVYPNPVKEIINFNTPQNVTKVEIFDIAGRMLSSNLINENKLNLSNLKTGNYLLKIYTDSGVSNTKIIKQ